MLKIVSPLTNCTYIQVKVLMLQWWWMNRGREREQPNEYSFFQRHSNHFPTNTNRILHNYIYINKLDVSVYTEPVSFFEALIIVNRVHLNVDNDIAYTCGSFKAYVTIFFLSWHRRNICGLFNNALGFDIIRVPLHLYGSQWRSLIIINLPFVYICLD